MDYPAALTLLETALKQPLPGPDAHRLASPRPRREWPSGFDPSGVRIAAALLILFPIDDRAHVVLTRRADHLGRHGGQVSLPGGGVEPGETYEHAALREAREEVGLASDAVRILGALTPLDIPISGFRLHPIVAAASSRPMLAASDNEVAQILEVGVDALLDPSAWRQEPLVREGQTITAPAFAVHGVHIWGATAMVLAEFLALLGWAGPRF